jgi:hypothetical protein
MAKYDNNILTRKELMKLKRNLPKGFRDLAASKLDVSIAYVTMVLSGTRKNNTIIQMAIEYAEIHKQDIHSLKEKIKNL